jgi:hypothetical protein
MTVAIAVGLVTLGAGAAWLTWRLLRFLCDARPDRHARILRLMQRRDADRRW